METATLFATRGAGASVGQIFDSLLFGWWCS